jgi:hypothetical protein
MELKLKNPMTAVALSSLVPGLGHVYLGEKKKAVGFFGGVAGGVGFGQVMSHQGDIQDTSFRVYAGWITQRSNSLKESTAVHTWYDFTLMAASTLARGLASIGGQRHIALSFTF